jgi:hypothetical protein
VRDVDNGEAELALQAANVAYGLLSSGTRRPAAEALADEALATVYDWNASETLRRRSGSARGRARKAA